MNSKSYIRFLGWLGALFLVVLGAKFWVIRRYGTGIIYWDQWDEAALLFKPWLEGHLTWGALIAPHNEHRIFFTRVLDLFIVWLNGQWDPKLQMVINAFIHASFAGMLAYCVWSFTGKKHGALICLMLAPFFVLPFAAENTIHGFQSQMYFLSIFSLTAILGLGFGMPGSIRWFFGLAAAFIALFTMGSGLLASLAVTGLMVLRAMLQKRITRDLLITATCAMAVFLASVTLNVTVPQSQGFRAHSFLVFLDALMSGLAWPFWNAAPMMFVLCLPLIFTCLKYFQPGFKNPRAAELVLTLGFWGVLQIAGLAFARAGLGNSSRYMDTFCIIPIASAASWFVLAENFDLKRGARRIMPILWAGILLVGLWQASQKTLLDYLPWSLKWELLEEDNVRDFVNTDNPAYLSGSSPLAIPYWSSDRLITLLRDPKLQTILPPTCRPTSKVEKDLAPSGFISKNTPLAGATQDQGQLSHVARLLLNHAIAIFTAGLVLMLAVTSCMILGKELGDRCVCPMIALIVLLTWTDIWMARRSDDTQLATNIHKEWAQRFAATRDWAGAERQWREVLWLEPGDITAREQLRKLEATSGPSGTHP